MHTLVDENGKEIAVYEALKRYGAGATYEPPQTAGEEVDAKVKKLRLEHPSLSYSAAMRLILDDDRNLKVRLAREGC